MDRGRPMIGHFEPYQKKSVFSHHLNLGHYNPEKLAADSFSTGEAWRIPAELLYNKNCILAMTDPNPNVYHESKGWKN
jgi:hypothetical protein